MYFDDNDFEQKRRLQKILWNMGYWARIEIPIVIYEDDSKNNSLQKHYLTDIDVYGEYTQFDFSCIKSIGDCKSGKNVKIFERLFWLKGVKEYLNAEKAYLVKKTISSKAKIFLPKLDITGVDANALTELEKIYHSSNDSMLFGIEYYKSRIDAIMQLTDEYKKIYDYLYTRYWFTDLSVSMRVIMTMLQKKNFYESFDKTNKVHRFLLLEVCILFTRTVIDCCRYAIARDLINIDVSVIEYIHGGTDGFNNKMQMVREFNHYIKEFTGDKNMTNSVLVKPDYFDELLKLVIVLIGEAYNAKDIIRYLEIMQHEVLLEKEIDYKKVLGINYSSVGHKLSKDVLTFYLVNNKIDSTFFSDIIGR